MKRLVGLIGLFSVLFLPSLSNAESVYHLITKTHPSISGQFENEIIKNSGYGRMNITMTPLAVGNSDGKGLTIRDAAGKYLSFYINDDNSFQIWNGVWHDGGSASGGVVLSDNSEAILAGESYEFVIYIKEDEVMVYRVVEEGIDLLFQYPTTFVLPIRYSLKNQRTGVKFDNVRFTQ